MRAKSRSRAAVQNVGTSSTTAILVRVDDELGAAFARKELELAKVLGDPGLVPSRTALARSLLLGALK
jgi:hypothetical protein